ncbi:probable long-chain-alcohol O-fatty-acyltransferase 5, partial [Phoenix dactylifera]|uniref:Probable long-chain-alcohol O-fatty-acyltransferase 5 n=1 Tax=Phoenix dactylifera TaxID=42345 RepID=A0A8B8ZEJ1_PHODC
IPISRRPTPSLLNPFHRSHPFSSAERSPSSRWGESLLMQALSKRRTWVFLFLVVYSLLLSSSWNLLLSIRSWYNSAAASASSRATAGWKALYASVLYGGVFGLLSMGAALAVAVPATLVTWITILVLLALFKLLLLAFGLGPLCPSLPLLPFLFTSFFPVKIQTKPKPKPPISSSLSTLHRLITVVRVLLLATIISSYRYSDRMHPYLLLAIYCCHIYLILDLGLASIAKIATGLLGLELEPQFNNPLGASSLQDFWGRRWNLMVSSILRPSVYDPVQARWGLDAGILATFFVSGLMHELMFYYLTLALPTGEVTAFFVLHGLLTVVERKARKAG